MHKRDVNTLSNLYETLKKLCEEKGINGAQMCREVGYSKSLMTELKSGRKKSLSADVAAKIANYFDVSVDYLLGHSQQKKPITEAGNEHRGITDDDIKFALFGGDDGITDEMWEDVKRYAKFRKENNK